MPPSGSQSQPTRTGRLGPAGDANDVSLAALADGIGAAFAAHEPLLRQRLVRLEAALERADEATRDRAAERLVLVHVGLGCLSEAIDELAAELGGATRGAESRGRSRRRVKDER